MFKVQVKNLRFSIDKKEILKDISFDIPKGSFVGVIGPNGSGKSTLLKNIYRLYKPSSGSILLDNKELVKMKDKDCAKEIAVLAQESNTHFDFTVEQIVKMGRYPYKSVFEDYSKGDLQMVKDMLQKVGLESYSERNFSELSGGEKQRTLIGRALVQNTNFLILDEPTNHLDIGYQIQLMDLVKSLNITTLSAIHDINLASMYCDYLIVMKDGKIISFGTVEEVINSEMLKDVFGVNAYVGVNPVNKKIQVSFMHTHEHIKGLGTDHIHEDGFTGVHTH
jgi:iron complex transport system ATP-binding protein